MNDFPLNNTIPISVFIFIILTFNFVYKSAQSGVFFLYLISKRLYMLVIFLLEISSSWAYVNVFLIFVRNRSLINNSFSKACFANWAIRFDSTITQFPIIIIYNIRILKGFFFNFFFWKINLQNSFYFCS